MAKGVELDAAVVEPETGVSLSTWQELMDRMKQAGYGVIFSGTNPTTPFDSHQAAHALFALVRDMNAMSRFVCLPLTRMGNGTGAEAVLTWQTGYPFAVSLARGYPRFGPGEYTADAVLGRGRGRRGPCDRRRPQVEPFTRGVGASGGDTDGRDRFKRYRHDFLRESWVSLGHVWNQYRRHGLSCGRRGDSPPPRPVSVHAERSRDPDQNRPTNTRADGRS